MTTLLKYKLEKLPHNRIEVINNMLVYAIDLLKIQKIEENKKVHLAIINRFYKNTVRKKFEKSDPPKTTTLKMDLDEMYCLYWVCLIYTNTQSCNIYEMAIINQLKETLNSKIV